MKPVDEAAQSLDERWYANAAEVARLKRALEKIASCECHVPHVCSEGVRRCVTCIARDALAVAIVFPTLRPDELSAERDRAVARAEKAEQERDEALHWEDVDDEWTEQIDAAFPTRSGSHQQYAAARKMVGHRHSKGQLVALVNWILVERDAALSRTESLREVLTALTEFCADEALYPLAYAGRFRELVAAAHEVLAATEESR